MRALALVALIGLTACGDARPADGPRSGTAEGTAGATGGSANGAPGARGPGAAGGPTPEVRGLPKSTGEVELEVLQRGGGQASLGPTVRLEREVEGRFVDAGAVGLTLRPSCDRPAPACTRLAPGFALRPPPWNGRVGGPGQCEPATAGRRAEPGVYRFVLSGCAGEQVVGSPFEVSP